MNIICIFFKVDKFTSQSVQHYWKRIEILFFYVNYSKHKCLWSFIFNYDSIWNPMFKRKVDFLRVNHDKLKPYDFLTYLNKLNNNWNVYWHINLEQFVSEMLTLKGKEMLKMLMLLNILKQKQTRLDFTNSWRGKYHKYRSISQSNAWMITSNAKYICTYIRKWLLYSDSGVFNLWNMWTMSTWYQCSLVCFSPKFLGLVISPNFWTTNSIDINYSH